MKYCAVAAGALGLSTSSLMKLEKAMATTGGTKVVWLNGAACTGCTVSLANTATLASIQDLLVNWPVAAQAISDETQISLTPAALSPTDVANALVSLGLSDNSPTPGPLDLKFMETLSSSVGQVALDAADTVLGQPAGNPFVLCIEGAIQTGANGNYLTVGGNKFKDEVFTFATDQNCLAILAVGTCASFGGIPASKGSITDARGLMSTGKISGGYKTTNTTGFWDYLKGTAVYKSVASIKVVNPGAGYTTAPAVTITSGTGSGAIATASVSSGRVVSISVSDGGINYTTPPTISFGGPGTGASAVAKLGLTPGSGLSNAQWTNIMGKTICVSGCPPHPDWIVGTIVYLLTYGEPPLMDKWHRPLDFYGLYQCTNCLWKTNTPPDPAKTKGGVSTGNSPKLFKYRYNSQYEGCIGVLGCKGRKTKADCSLRRWNSNTKGGDGVGWCVQTRAGCHGCTEPRFPDGWGKFFSYK